MSTAKTPRWGDGQSATHLIDAEVTIDSDLLDAPVRDSLYALCEKAFERDPGGRYDNAADMLAAWHNAFARAAATDSRGTDELAQQIALESVRPDTLVSQLGVSARAQNTLDRLGIYTAQELAAQPPGRFSSLRGVGNKTRREIMDLIGKLRTRLPQPAIPDRSIVEGSAWIPADNTDAPSSLDALPAHPLPREPTSTAKLTHHI